MEKKKKGSGKLDFYELLELDKNTATPETIKSSYKKLALVTKYSHSYLLIEMAS